MKPNLRIAQALFEGSSLLVRSSDFIDAWLPEAQRLCAGFGSPPAGIEFQEALFTLHLGKNHVAIVQVAGSSHWATLRFRFLIMGQDLYRFLHDPFAIAERYPTSWTATHELPSLAWPEEVLPGRTLAQLDAVLKNGDGPFLLGAAQTLVDGAKILLQRPLPETTLLRDLWALLPDSIRRTTSLTTFAFSAELRCDILVLPTLPEQSLPGYLNEEQTRDYPESRYERNLQEAIEMNDAPALERLLARKSTSEMIHFAGWLLLGLAFLTIAVRWTMR